MLRYVAGELTVCPSALRGLIEPGADVAERWRAGTTPMSTRREIARLLLTPKLIGELRLQPAPRWGRHRTPARECIQLVARMKQP